MIKLGINIDHIATLRQARRENFPSPVEAAAFCEKAGADSITVHLREDRRHIQDSDVISLRQTLRTKLNLEMAPTPEITAIACSVKPDFVCLVPEKRQELTTEGGLDVAAQKDYLKDIVSRLKDKGIIVSMFIDSSLKQVEAASAVGADAIEIHTGNYAKYFNLPGAGSANEESPEFSSELSKIALAAEEGAKLGLTINAGHGLDYDNIAPICAIKEMNEFNIGFSIIAKAVFTGLETAVKEMKQLIGRFSA